MCVIAVPLVYPTDVTYDPDSLKATDILLTWTQVDTSAERIRGFFRGYRVSDISTEHRASLMTGCLHLPLIIIMNYTMTLVPNLSPEPH